ncbi:MAG: phosphotransferase enzyme family protein [Gammaproteobacteria bacterium]
MILTDKLKYQLASDALEYWNLEVKDLSLLSIHTENIVFKVEDLLGNSYALRIHRFGYHDFVELQSEHIWTSYLSESGLKVPEFINNKKEEPYTKVSLRNSDEYRYVGLVRWISGQTLEEKLLKEPSEKEVSSIFEKLGEIIANFHLISLDWTEPKGFKRSSWDEEGLMGKDPTWGTFADIKNATQEERSQLSRIQDNLYLQLKELPKGNYYSMIHADMNGGNILVDKDSLSIIDFDDCCFGWHASDLANALWSSDPRNSSLENISRKSLSKGYSSIRDNADQVLANIDLFYLIRELQILKWVEDREKEIGDIKPIIDPLLKSALNRAKQMEII